MTSSLTVWRPATSGIGQEPVTIDHDTGEILDGAIPPLTFRDLVEAERYLYQIAGGEESLKLGQIKAIKASKDQQLYPQKQDEEGGLYSTVEPDLTDLCQQLTALDGA